MPKFKKDVEELEDRFDKWLYILRNLNRLDRIPETLREEIFEKLFEVAEIAKFTKEELRSYEDSLKYYRDLNNSLELAKEEGREEGINEERIRIVKKGIETGLSLELLSELTGLNQLEIENLILKIKNGA